MAKRIGLLHPGEMGASLGAALVAAGHDVLWVEAGRSDATRARAQAAGLTPRTDLGNLASECDALLSVCPPAFARAVADAAAAAGFRGLYVDANAISPDSARQIAGALEPRGIAFVDGGIIGPPLRGPDSTHLHLAGDRAAEVADWFEGSDLVVALVPGPVGAASALKMCFAAWSKGSTALLASVFAAACAEGVDEALRAEWDHFAPDVEGRLRALSGSVRKAWRFAGEMEEIAATFAAVHAPDGFHREAARVFEQLADFKDTSERPAPERIAERLLRSRERQT